MMVRHPGRTARRILTAAASVVLLTGLGTAVPASPALAAPGPSFTNPLVGSPNSADPSIVYTNGNWYYVATTWSSRIVMRTASTMAGLKNAPERTIYTLAA